eukprot:4101933-Prymnesium_polylepis.1
MTGSTRRLRRPPLCRGREAERLELPSCNKKEGTKRLALGEERFAQPQMLLAQHGNHLLGDRARQFFEKRNHEIEWR